jgi:penicillin-binding protein 1C
MSGASVSRHASISVRRLAKGAFFAFAAICTGTALAVGALYFFGTPDAEELLSHRFAQTSTVYDRTGRRVLYEVHGEEDRKVVPHDGIADVVRLATVAAEDASFYEHHGLDFAAIVRAAKANLESGRRLEGASTITQQLARTVFLDRQKTVSRKVAEALLALKIERRFSKDEILDLYLNSVPYGSNAYGVQSAAETFFHKDAKDLTLDEAALLAALPQAPGSYSPYGNRRAELVARQKKILLRMGALGMADGRAVERALAADTLSRLAPPRHDIEAPHFVMYVVDELEKKYGQGVLETGGWKVYTTLDYDLQQKAERAVRDGVRRNLAQGAENAALVAVDPKNGDVLAMVGSRDFFDTAIDGQVNVALRPRQPGSSFKPFAYAKAFEKGYQPETLLYDIRTSFGPDGSGKDYVPNNYDGGFRGLLSMRMALANSLNIPAVQTLYLAGVQETIDLVHRMGITTLEDRNRYGLSLVLGGGEVKLLDMVSAFSTFATEGERHAPQIIMKIVGPDGKTVAQGSAGGSGERVLDVQTARKINSVLSDNGARSMVFGPSSPLAFPDHTVAAKTGTTQEFRDAWTVGYTPSIAAGVWAGNNDNRPMKRGADGVFAAAPIWRDFLDRVLDRYPKQSFAPYDPVATGKPMLSGRPEQELRYYRKSSGKEVPPEKAVNLDPGKLRVKNAAAPHSVLYYVDRNDPLGDTPPDPGDPMARRWEEALQADGREDF